MSKPNEMLNLTNVHWVVWKLYANATDPIKQKLYDHLLLDIKRTIMDVKNIDKDGEASA